MNFNDHSGLEGQHAFLGASRYHWTNYDEDKLSQAYLNRMATERGVKLHALAHDLIELGVKLPKTRTTLNMFVNDAIGYHMKSEVILFYSFNCFGCTDAIAFRNDVLRIHDLKTGACPTSMRQLEIYAALFCLEYKIKPSNIRIELRIYQSSEIEVYEPESEVISELMEKIVESDKVIEKIRLGV